MSLISTDTFKNLFSEGLLFKKQIIFHMKNDRTEHFCTTIILSKTGHYFAIMCKSEFTNSNITDQSLKMNIGLTLINRWYFSKAT